MDAPSTRPMGAVETLGPLTHLASSTRLQLTMAGLAETFRASINIADACMRSETILVVLAKALQPDMSTVEMDYFTMHVGSPALSPAASPFYVVPKQDVEKLADRLAHFNSMGKAKGKTLFVAWIDEQFERSAHAQMLLAGFDAGDKGRLWVQLFDPNGWGSLQPPDERYGWLPKFGAALFEKIGFDGLARDVRFTFRFAMLLKKRRTAGWESVSTKLMVQDMAFYVNRYNLNRFSHLLDRLLGMDKYGPPQQRARVLRMVHKAGYESVRDLYVAEKKGMRGRGICSHVVDLAAILALGSRRRGQPGRMATEWMNLLVDRRSSQLSTPAWSALIALETWIYMDAFTGGSLPTYQTFMRPTKGMFTLSAGLYDRQPTRTERWGRGATPLQTLQILMPRGILDPLHITRDTARFLLRRMPAQWDPQTPGVAAKLRDDDGEVLRMERMLRNTSNLFVLWKEAGTALGNTREREALQRAIWSPRDAMQVLLDEGAVRKAVHEVSVTLLRNREVEIKRAKRGETHGPYLDAMDLATIEALSIGTVWTNVTDRPLPFVHMMRWCAWEAFAYIRDTREARTAMQGLIVDLESLRGPVFLSDGTLEGSAAARKLQALMDRLGQLGVPAARRVACLRRWIFAVERILVSDMLSDGITQETIAMRQIRTSKEFWREKGKEEGVVLRRDIYELEFKMQGNMGGEGTMHRYVRTWGFRGGIVMRKLFSDRVVTQQLMDFVEDRGYPGARPQHGWRVPSRVGMSLGRYMSRFYVPSFSEAIRIYGLSAPAPEPEPGEPMEVGAKLGADDRGDESDGEEEEAV